MSKLTKYIVLLLIFLLLFSSMVVCHAAEGNVVWEKTISESAAGEAMQIITIRGTAVQGAANRFVTLKIWKPGMEESKLGTQSDDLNLFAIVLQTRADKDGNFAFVFRFEEEQATYRADIKVQGSGNMISLDIETANILAIQDFIKKINNADELAKMGTEDFAPLIENSATYGTDVNIFLKLGKPESILNAVLADLRQNKKTGKINNMQAVNDFLAQRSILGAFALSDDDKLLQEVLERYRQQLALADLEGARGIYETYQNMTFSNQASTLKTMGKHSYQNISELQEAFKRQTLVCAVRGIENYAALEEIIENNLDYIALDETKLSKYKGSEAVKTYVLKSISRNKNQTDSAKALCGLFENAVDSYEAPDKQDDEKKGGGGGSSSGNNKMLVDTALAPNVAQQTPKIRPVFPDIAEHWGKTAIMSLAGKEIVNGREDGLFAPDDTVTRAEFVKMLVTAFGFYDATSSAKFEDVAPEQWHYRFIASAAARNIVRGMDGRFNPNDNISRQDMALMLYRALQVKEALPVIKNLEVRFDDFNEIASYAQNSVSYLSNMGLLQGSDRKFRPFDQASRAESAQIFYNALTEVGIYND